MANKKKKPSIKKLLNLLDREKELENLRDEIQEEKQKLFEKYGEQVFTYELEEPYLDSNEKEIKFVRVKLNDNINKLREDGFAFRAAKIFSYEVKLEELQRKPKEHKE